MNTRNEKIEQSVVYWDETDIWDRRVEDLMECEELSREDAEERANESLSWVTEDEWDWMTELLSEVMGQVSSRFVNKGYWLCEGSNLGWRGRSGYKVVEAYNGADLLRKVLPDTHNTFYVFRPDDRRTPELTINNFHHDTRFSGMGGEWYTLTPMRSIEVQAWETLGYMGLEEFL
jgi:hypothetical protein